MQHGIGKVADKPVANNTQIGKYTNFNIAAAHYKTMRFRRIMFFGERSYFQLAYINRFKLAAGDAPVGHQHRPGEAGFRE
jgi:hypothetical protein